MIARMIYTLFAFLAGNTFNHRPRVFLDRKGVLSERFTGIFLSTNPCKCH